MNEIIKNRPWINDILKKPEMQDITLINLYVYYLTNNNINKLLPIITSNSNISIRVLDWFVTNYSKKYNILYKLNNDDNNYFNVYLQYKCQLKSYKKKLFDPFCRKKRIFFYYDNNKCIITTIGQLNFFKWAIENDILNYVSKNLELINIDMINSNKYHQSKSESSSESDKIRKKRRELSNSANKTINIQNYNIVLTFD
jgi:hypothetical protein